MWCTSSVRPFVLTAKGRAEATRLAFIVSGQEFEDRRINFADFPTVMQETPWSVLPFLNVSRQIQDRKISTFVMSHMCECSFLSLVPAHVPFFLQLYHGYMLYCTRATSTGWCSFRSFKVAYESNIITQNHLLYSVPCS